MNKPHPIIQYLNKVAMHTENWKYFIDKIENMKAKKESAYQIGKVKKQKEAQWLQRDINMQIIHALREAMPVTNEEYNEIVKVWEANYYSKMKAFDEVWENL